MSCRRQIKLLNLGQQIGNKDIPIRDVHFF